MAKTRREFHTRVQREAVRPAGEQRPAQMQVAAELGIQPSMLRQWRATLNGGPHPAAAGRIGGGECATKPIASPSDQAAEIAGWRRELDRTRMERDVLKNVWPATSARWSMKAPVTGLHKRIRHVGTVAAARWRAARLGPHKHDGLDGPAFFAGFRDAARPSGHLSIPRRIRGRAPSGRARARVDLSRCLRQQPAPDVARSSPPCATSPGDPRSLAASATTHDVVVGSRQKSAQPPSGRVLGLRQRGPGRARSVDEEAAR